MNKILALILISLLDVGCSCQTVPPGTVGIAVDTQGIRETIYTPGLWFNSVFCTMTPMSTQTEIYEMAGEDSIHVLTHDQLSVDLEVTVAFHLNEHDAIEVFTAYNADYAERIIHPIVRTAVRDAASQMTAIQLVDQRDVLQQHMEQDVHDQIVSTLRSRNLPEDSFVVENVLLRNIDLPQSLDEAIAAVQQQTQATARQQQALATAEAQAQVVRTTAEGEATARLIRAHAEADSNRIIAESLTPQVLRARQIDLTGQLLANDHTRIVMIPESGMPLFQLPTE